MLCEINGDEGCKGETLGLRRIEKKFLKGVNNNMNVKLFGVLLM